MTDELSRICTGAALVAAFSWQAPSAGEKPAPPASDKFYQDVAWSPDGEWIAYSEYAGGEYATEKWSIYIARRDGSEPRLLAPNSTWVSWSPDGAQLAFQSERDGDPEVYVVDADGKNVIRITDNPASDSAPAWSPDGARIAFESTRATPADFEGPARDPERTADFDVFVVDADGGEPENLSRDVQRLQKFPDWSPDGRWLAVDEEGVVAFVPADGSGPILRLAGDALRGGFPAWAPAG